MVSRTRLITIVCSVAVIAAAYYGYSFYHENIKVFSVNKVVKIKDITVNVDEVSLIPRFILAEPFHREVTVKGTVTDISTDGKYTKHLSELVKVYVKDGSGTGFGQDVEANYYCFWTYKIYDGNKTIDLIIDNSISNQNLPLKIDLRDYNSHWATKTDA